MHPEAFKNRASQEKSGNKFARTPASPLQNVHGECRQGVPDTSLEPPQQLFRQGSESSGREPPKTSADSPQKPPPRHCSQSSKEGFPKPSANPPQKPPRHCSQSFKKGFPKHSPEALEILLAELWRRVPKALRRPSQETSTAP